MGKKLLILSFLLFSISLLKGQTIKVKEPEFSGTAVFVNDTIGNGILLEQQTATLEEGIVTLKYAVKVCCSTVFADTINLRRFLCIR